MHCSHRSPVPRLPHAVSRRGPLRLRPVLRPARAGLRLRRSRAHADARRRSRRGPQNLWRYRELLPITGEPRTGFNSGFTPLVQAPSASPRASASASSTSRTTAVNHPTLSYKDRVVSVAATRAVEFGFTVFGCASTGNLANSVAAHAARLGLDLLRLHPGQPRGRQGRSARRSTARRSWPSHGNYDDVNRLCTQIADKLRLGLRQHQPAQLLRRGRQDVRLRDRRATRLALPEARRLAGGRRHAAAAHRARLPRAARGRAGRGRAAEDVRARRPRARAPVVRALARRASTIPTR